MDWNNSGHSPSVISCSKINDPKKQCILCLQHGTVKNKLVSKLNGIEKILKAVEVREDVYVLDRIISRE